MAKFISSTEPDDTPFDELIALIQVAFDRRDQGELLVVDRGNPALLCRILRALLPDFPTLDVVGDPYTLLKAPPGSVLIYVPLAAHASTLNLLRPRVSDQRLRVVLFCDEPTMADLRRNAPDFLDWATHTTKCGPPGLPLFVERGLLLADTVFEQRIAWQGGDPQRLFSSIFPTQRITVKATAVAEQDLCKILEETSDQFLICKDIVDAERLHNLEKAMEKTGRTSSIGLWKPKVITPNFWPVHERTLSAANGIAMLTNPSVERPGVLYGLMEGEAEAIEMLGPLLRSEQVLESVALLHLKRPVDVRSLERQGVERLLTEETKYDPNSPLLVRADAERIRTRGTLQRKGQMQRKGDYIELPDRDEILAYVRRYQSAFTDKFKRFEMVGIGVAQSVEAHRPMVADLEDMYVALRLDRDLDGKHSDRGREIHPRDLLKPKTRLVLCGPAGAGKTTWAKYTFRKLLSIENAWPLYVELRRLAKTWGHTDGPSAEFSFSDYVLRMLKESRLGLDEAGLDQLLRHPNVRPVLLIDGWDELGELGDKLRKALAEFLSTYPRVNVAATSRPYGQSRPAQAEHFRTLQIQSLSNEEIKSLSKRFFDKVYGGDREEARKRREQFWETLKASSSALSLARTPLLLMMMLLIGRDRPLAVKRHRLYQACIENLLMIRPNIRSTEGARLHDEQWTPDDEWERLRVVAELAYRMQSGGYNDGDQRVIMIPREIAESLLPSTWETWQRSGFLYWLIGAAGVMNDQTDGSLSFVHLSFQEFLCALWWKTNVEKKKRRIKICLEHAKDPTWWETLRLWAALVNDENPRHLLPVFEAMLNEKSAEPFWLLGAMLADGTGGNDIFHTWVEKLGLRFHVEEWDWAQPVAQAWVTRKEDEQRRKIENAWPALQKSWTFIQCLGAQDWAEAAKLNVGTDDAFEKLSLEAGSAQGMGRGRVLSGFSPLWPCEPLAPVLLRLWPTPRREISTRLTYLLLGTCEHFGEQDITASLLVPPPSDKANFLGHQGLMRNLAHSLEADVEQDVVRYLLRYFGRDLLREFMRSLGQDFARALGFELAMERSRNFERSSARSLAAEWVRSLARSWAPSLARSLAHSYGLDVNSSWIIDVAAIDLVSTIGRSTTRAALDHLNAQHLNSPLLELFRQACHLSLKPQTDPTPFNHALTHYQRQSNSDPLWPALARWIARRSISSDKTLLIHLAEHPELRKHDSALYHGLKYYVRGDVVLPDDSEQTLDYYCDKFNVPRLPLLEYMPPELDLRR